MDNNLSISPFCVDYKKFNKEFIKSLASSVTYIKIDGEFVLTKELFDYLVVYSNVNTLDVFDIEEFNYGNEIKINVLKNVSFNSMRYAKLGVNKVDGYNKSSLTINLPFKVYFEGDTLYSEEDDFNKLLKYIKNIEILNIKFDNVNVVNDVIDVVYRIEKIIGKKISSINCITNNRTIYNIDKLRFLEDDRLVKIWYEEGITDCSVSEFISMRKGIDSIINDVKSKNLSDFEKVIYVYDIVKKFSYNASLDNCNMDGRFLHKIFSTNKIVCSGYSRVIVRILNELGIRAGIYKLLTKDNELHARCLVHIQDDTYNIDSICSMEPTWESAINEDYAYSLFLTPVNKLKASFPKEKFRGDIDVLCGTKKINEISLSDRISLYQFFENKDLEQEYIDKFISMCCKEVSLNDFCKALINVKVAQGLSLNTILSNVSNIVKYNSELTDFLNLKMETNINFFSN